MYLPSLPREEFNVDGEQLRRECLFMVWTSTWPTATIMPYLGRPMSDTSSTFLRISSLPALCLPPQGQPILATGPETAAYAAVVSAAPKSLRLRSSGFQAKSTRT